MKIKNISIKERIREYFFINPSSKLRVRGIEKNIKLPLPSVIRYCKELKEEGILTISKVGNVVFYIADKTNPNFLLDKKLFNIKSLYISGLVEFLKIELSNPSLIVFGSYSKGEDIENSDIDLYIETPSKREIKPTEFEKKLKRKIQIFKHKKISEIKSKDLINNIINGVSLNGFIEILK
ncbi:nucleotidyltransferase domain-containing protein [Candidatus Woesearchaeota archaeon]|nr:nucleotidyltransferase domain-containing protein [Candidatus Woesearchaeota archaeon]